MVRGEWAVIFIVLFYFTYDTKIKYSPFSGVLFYKPTYLAMFFLAHSLFPVFFFYILTFSTVFFPSDVLFYTLTFPIAFYL